MEWEGRLPKRRKTCGELGLEEESLAKKVREAEQKVKKFEKHLEDLAQNLNPSAQISENSQSGGWVDGEGCGVGAEHTQTSGELDRPHAEELEEGSSDEAETSLSLPIGP